MKRILVCGIGTSVGKTLISAILVKALSAHYWKPVQSGLLKDSDTQRVKKLVPEAVCYAEAYRLRYPLSPHHAASLEGLDIHPAAFQVPAPPCPLVIEAAGGIFVPYRPDELLIDLYLKWNCEWIVVSRHYLGSINHTLLTIEALRRRKVCVRGIIFNGPDQPESEEAILKCSGIPCLGHVYPEPNWTAGIVQRYGELWKQYL